MPEQIPLHLPLRIGIWFNEEYTVYGGPAQVLIGTMLGFLEYAESIGRSVVLLLNAPGDVNWMADNGNLRAFDLLTRGLRRIVGPNTFSPRDFFIKDPSTSDVWRLGSSHLTVYATPSAWYGRWISHGLPFHDVAKWNRPMVVWGAGVNTDYFRPLADLPLQHQQQQQQQQQQPLHDYFVYFKSQSWETLKSVQEYLFQNYFRMHGPILMYYFYSHEELLEAAQRSRFCIYVGGVETQGLASLEIMATGCPLFVLDEKEFRLDGMATREATSVCCWEEGRCGMKSSVDNMAADFPRFLERVGEYRPREFVESAYSWKTSAGRLFRLLEDLP